MELEERKDRTLVRRGSMRGKAWSREDGRSEE